MRHGETDWNTRGLIQGSADIPLNENGIALARLTKEGLDKQGITFDKVFSSPFIRARKTAEIISGTNCEVEIDDRIQEMNFGKYEGISIKEVSENPEYKNMHNFFVKPDQFVAEEGCESYEEARKRVASFSEEQLFPNSSRWNNCLVVCHGAIIRSFLSYLCQRGLSDLWDLKQPNCCINIFDINEGSAALLETAKIFYNPDMLPKRKYT
jgi:broad specificity phosphatase PhoE